MEGGFLTVAFHIILGSALMMGLGMIPGLALIRALDPGADRLRQVMLAPAASLLCVFGIAGWTVVIRGEHNAVVLLLVIVLVNALSATVFWQRDIVRVRRLSAWERLEEIATAAEAEGGDTTTLEEDVAAEKAHSSLLAQGRPRWLIPAMVIAALVCITPLFIFERPMGVDWLGFATLSHRLATVGTLELPAPSTGFWSYPPAFPALAAMLEEVLGFSPSDSIHLLGQLSLLAVIFGVAGAADRWGASGHTLIALALAPAIFAKAFDSGYPTVASQLGLVLGLLVLVKPPRERKKWQDLVFAFGIAFVGVIHPTGSLYLGTLLIAWMCTNRFSAQKEETHSGRLAIFSAVVLGSAVVITLGAFAPRMLEDPVFAEYGWQGGLPFLAFNGPILIGLAGWALWRWRNSFEVWLLTLWLILQFTLTFVHLFDGLVGLSILSLIAYMLYSMALHGFHVPLAVLVGILLAKNPRLTARLREISIANAPAEGTEGKSSPADGMDSVDEMDGEPTKVIRIADSDAEYHELELPAVLPDNLLKVCAAIAIVAILFAHSVAFGMAQHPELEVQTPGDRLLSDALNDLDAGSIVYVEKAHWGIRYDAPEDIGITSFPSLGLLTVNSQIQSKVERAILLNNAPVIESYGVTHALTSPRGQIGFVLAQSPHWILLANEGGSRLWSFDVSPSDPHTSAYTFPDSENCWFISDDDSKNCEFRDEPWWDSDSNHIGFGQQSVPFISEGEILLQVLDEERSHRDADVRIFVQYSSPIGLDISVSACFDSNRNDCTTKQEKSTIGGMTTIELLLHTPPITEELWITITVSGGGDTFLNPAGLSGRSDRIVDQSGLWLHWVEVRDL